MFFISRPDQTRIDKHLNRAAERALVYPRIGSTQMKHGSTLIAPKGYLIDHNRICLGSGAETYARAKAALDRWDMFNFDWVELIRPDKPFVGQTVGILIRAMGIWSLNAGKVVYTMDQQGDVARYGFAYGTLPDHAESGEERFSVEWDRNSDSVFYDLLAFSRPNQLLARIGSAYVRHLQRRFQRDSMQAMLQE